MKGMTKTTIATVGVPILLLAAGIAFAQDWGPRGPRAGGPGGEFGPPPIESMAERLGVTLSDDQRTQLEALREKSRESTRPLAEAAQQAREAFRKQLGAAAPDPSAVGQAALAMRATEDKLRAARRASLQEAKGILTAEQWQTVQKALLRHGPRGADEHEE